MKVTVMLVVYNGEKYISKCIKSILEQTFSDFELLIIDDGSTDRTIEIIKGFKDTRIKLLKNNHDYIASLNLGLQESCGDYIARMDADDIMYPLRLEEQVNILDTHQEIDVCGSWARTFGLVTFDIHRGKYKIINPLAELLLKNIFTHSTMMIRKNFLTKNKLAYKKYSYAEDYKLWLDITLCDGNFWIIPQNLVSYRISENQISYIHYKEQKKTTIKIQNEALLAILNDEKCLEIETLQYIYNKLEYLNKNQHISADLIRQIIYYLYKNLKKENI